MFCFCKEKHGLINMGTTNVPHGGVVRQEQQSNLVWSNCDLQFVSSKVHQQRLLQCFCCVLSFKCSLSKNLPQMTLSPNRPCNDGLSDWEHYVYTIMQNYRWLAVQYNGNGKLVANSLTALKLTESINLLCS